MAVVSPTVCSVKQALSGKIEAGSKVTVRGWVRTRRDSKAGLSFVNVTDGSCFDPIQAVVPASLDNYTSEVLHLTAGAGVIVNGTLVPSQGKGQSFELQADEVIVTGLVDDPETYPIQPKQHSMEFLREVAHLRPRTNLFGAVTRVRHTMMTAIHRHLTEQGFFWINTPIITTSDAEGAGDMFRLSTLDLANLPRDDKGKIDFRKDFFGREAFLTVSGQLNVEAYAMAMSKVYTFGPTFRAENSNTPRHLAEFWMVEPEIAFADLVANADCAEAFLKAIFKAVLDERADDMAFFAERVQPDAISRMEAFISQPFERIDYTNAITILQKSGQKFEYPVAWKLSLPSHSSGSTTPTRSRSCRSPGRSSNSRSRGAWICKLNTNVTSPRNISAVLWS